MSDAETASLIATKLASETAQKASDLARQTADTAVSLATKTAETTAVINTNIEWMKKSLTSIEIKLNEMDKAFVTYSQHADVLKELADHETRINGLETERTRTTVLMSVASALLGIVIALLIWHIQQG
jgi:hypothetical protein